MDVSETGFSIHKTCAVKKQIKKEAYKDFTPSCNSSLLLNFWIGL